MAWGLGVGRTLVDGRPEALSNELVDIGLLGPVAQLA